MASSNRVAEGNRGLRHPRNPPLAAHHLAGVRRITMTNGIRLSAALLAVTACSGALSADDTQVYQLEPSLVVTPSRTAKPIADALASVSVLTR